MIRRQAVKFNVQGRGSISCGDGQKANIDASRRMTFNFGNGGVSCLVALEGGHKCAGYIETGGTCSCTPSSDALICR